MKKNLLLTPGPTQIPPELCAVLGRPIIHHRTPQFQQSLKEALDGLRYVFQTTNDIFPLVGSGTAGMEATVANVVSPGDKVITVEGGKFGERWTELCKVYGAMPHVIEVVWGKAVTPAQMKDALKACPDVKAVFITHNETSTGVATDVKAIADVVKATNAILVVDAISGMGVIDLQMDNWGVDMVVSASHKGFMLPPGLTFIAVNAKAWKMVETAKSPRYYFDLRKAKKTLAVPEKPDTPFTTAIGIVIALAESVKWFKSQGLEKLFAHYSRLARATRAAAKALGLTLLADDVCISNALTAIVLPENLVAGKIVKAMRDTYGISIAAGQGDMKDRMIRIAHMGCVDEYDILSGISCLEKVLKDMGHPCEIGAGVSAAQKSLNG